MAPGSDNNVIVLQNVARKFRRGGGEFYALQDITLTVRTGEVLVITGRSGSGKTTLLDIVGGLEQASAGTVTVCGRDLGQLGEGGLADFRRDKVGFVFQAFHLIEEQSALANVMLPLAFADISRKQAAGKAMHHLERVGLADIAREKVRTFSAGQKQRTALARGLVNDPELLIADEPTGNLDKENGRAVFDILCRAAADAGRAVLIATHDISVLPDGMINRIALENGRISLLPQEATENSCLNPED